VIDDGAADFPPARFPFHASLCYSLAMRTVLTSLLLATAFLLASAVQAADPVKHVDAQAAAKLLKEDSGVVVLDIRRAVELEDGRIARAKNIDFYGKDFADQLKALDREKPYLVHCASGGRSTKSLETFKKLGFKQIYHLDGGFNGWKEAGLPVEKK
jgi:phage shock protein E